MMSEEDDRNRPVHVLVVNQHGDNRGDEAATTAMLEAIEARLAPVRFTVLHQFQSRESEVEVPQEVRWLPLKLPLREVPTFVLFLALRLFRLEVKWLLGPSAAAAADAYEEADVLVSAPGGPYIGDIYADHEPVHWLYVWMARLYRCPSVLYAPSAGPFDLKWRNPLRRFTFRCFERVTLRERRSAALVRGLMGKSFEVEVTADSALQSVVQPLRRADWQVGGESMEDKFLLVVSAIDYAYAGDPDPQARRRNYDESVVAAVVRFCEVGAEGGDCHVAFLPQLHAPANRDTPYLESLASRVPGWISTEVVDETLTAHEQRARFATADAVIAGRYHPAVFSISAGVPVLCVPYEHKATGMMESAGIGDHVLGLADVTPDTMSTAAEELWADRQTVVDKLAESGLKLREAALRTSDIVAEVAGSSPK